MPSQPSDSIFLKHQWPCFFLIWHSLLNELHDGSDLWKIVVRVVRKWNVYQKHSPTDLFCISMLLMDEQGTKIWASAINKNLHARFLRDITEDKVYFIANFSVSRSSTPYRPSSHPFKITITNFTHVEEKVASIPTMIYSFVPLIDIINSPAASRSEQLVDVLTFVKCIGKLEQRAGDVEDDRVLLRLILTDCSGNEVECVLYDQCATDAYIAQNDDMTNPIVVLLNLAKIGSTEEGAARLGSSFNATRVIFNPPITEARDLRASVQESSTPVTTQFSQDISSISTQSSRTKTLASQPTIAISGISDQETGKPFVIHAQIAKLETRNGWTYYGCTKCGTKPKVESLSDWNGQEPCSGCRRRPHSVEPKLKLTYTVKDDSGNICVVFWDKLASQLVHKSAVQFKLQLDKENRPFDVPNELESVLGKKMLIQLKKNDYNKRFPSSGISVMSFSFCEDLNDQFDNAASEGSLNVPYGTSAQQNTLSQNPCTESSHTAQHADIVSGHPVAVDSEDHVTCLDSQVQPAPVHTMSKRKIIPKKNASGDEIAIVGVRSGTTSSDGRLLKSIKQEK